MPAKGKKKKRGSSVHKQGRDSLFLPGWLHWLFTVVLMLLVSVGGYFCFLRPYLYRLRPCRGTREYGVCLPSGFLCYGIDVSHHQGQIDWNEVALSSAASEYPIRFVIMKATEGVSFTDPSYTDNITQARKAGFVCGVYHFFDPGISPLKQAQHYINTVHLNKGDFAPVVDVERTGRSSGDLQRELLEFLGLLESHYGVKPIIYSSAKFRKRHLNAPSFDSYPFWVAHYYVVRPETAKPWLIWQFTDRARVAGIREYVDFNVFKGSESQFNSLRVN